MFAYPHASKLLLIYAVCTLLRCKAHAETTITRDTLVFINGERLSGSLERADASGVTFKSAMAGEITVKWCNIQELQSDKDFALLTRNARITRRNAAAVVPQGKVSVADKQLTVATADGPRVVPLDQADRLVSADAFDRAVNHPPSLLGGWAGTASGGVSLVRATQNATSFNGAVSVERLSPRVDWLPARDRTTLDYSQSYGRIAQPGTLTIRTNIFHAAAERDQYFSPRVFAFGNASFDHNVSQLLSLQQAYGGGVGITLLKSASRQLDFKGDVHYEKQEFLPDPIALTAAQPTQNLFGSTFSEKYLRYLPLGIVLNEFGSVSPAWNNLDAYSAHANASLTFPVYRGVGFNVGFVDDYLNNAPLGSQRNTTQFTTGVSYAIRPR